MEQAKQLAKSKAKSEAAAAALNALKHDNTHRQKVAALNRKMAEGENIDKELGYNTKLRRTGPGIDAIRKAHKTATHTQCTPPHRASSLVCTADSLCTVCGAQAHKTLRIQIMARYDNFKVCFKEIDADGSGVVRRNELRRFMRSLSKTIPDNVTSPDLPMATHTAVCTAHTLAPSFGAPLALCTDPCARRTGDLGSDQLRGLGRRRQDAHAGGVPQDDGGGVHQVRTRADSWGLHFFGETEGGVRQVEVLLV